MAMLFRRSKTSSLREDPARMTALPRDIIEPHRILNLKENLARFVLYYERLKLSYTFIPKNGCGHLKYNFGLADGTMEADTADVHIDSEKYLNRSWYPHLA